MAFAKEQRMTSRDFRKVFKGGSWVRGRTLSLRFGTAPHMKIAVVVQAKATKNAVERNRIRRQVVEIMQDLLKGKIVDSWIAVIVHTHPVSEEEIRSELRALLRKSGIMQRT